MAKRTPLWVLGISASHNGAACLLKGDEIIVAIQEERLSGFKRHRIYGAKPSLSVPYCLNYAGIRPRDLSAIILCAGGHARSTAQDIRRNPLFKGVLGHVPVLTIPHHFGHAMSAFATSGFEESSLLVIDGMGSPYEDLFEDERRAVRRRVRDGWETASLYAASGTSLTVLEKHLVEKGHWLLKRRGGMPLFGSLGGMYSAVAHQLFGDAMEAGKVMGLAPYGIPRLAPEQFFEVTRGGSFIFRDVVPQAFRHNDRWPAREDEYRDLAASVQSALESAILYLAKRLRSLNPSENLCYAGGVALNSVVNERLIRESGFKRVHITPVADDSGPAIGAAYYGLWHLRGVNTRRRMVHDGFGRPYAGDSVLSAVHTTPGVRFIRSRDVISDAVELLCSGKIIGWFDGRSELGPRALGQRSIICDPRRPDGKAILNLRVKKREAFRPFAPAILLEEAEDWFDLGGAPPASPFMLRVCKFRPGKADVVPAVAHVDNTGRLQTVTRAANGRFYELIRRFHKRTGVPLLLNTSFNVMGRPIVETPEDALSCLLESGLDCCVFEEGIISKDVDW